MIWVRSGSTPARLAAIGWGRSTQKNALRTLMLTEIIGPLIMYLVELPRRLVLEVRNARNPLVHPLTIDARRGIHVDPVFGARGSIAVDRYDNQCRTYLWTSGHYRVNSGSRARNRRRPLGQVS